MKNIALLVVGAVVFGFSSPALASAVSGPPSSFSVAVSSSETGDLLTFDPVLSATPGGDFTGTIFGLAPSISVTASFTVNADPTISGSFMLTNLSNITQIFSVSATLGLNPFGGPTTFHGGYGESTYSDANGDSNVTFASPTLAFPGTVEFMTALIDGSTVAVVGAFNDNANGGPGIAGTQGPESFGPSSGPGITSSIGTAFAFSLTPGDTVSVPFEFVVVPEPEGLAAFAIVFALFLCTFAQKSASAWK